MSAVTFKSCDFVEPRGDHSGSRNLNNKGQFIGSNTFKYALVIQSVIPLYTLCLTDIKVFNLFLLCAFFFKHAESVATHDEKCLLGLFFKIRSFLMF